ncbi:uncharacterized protein C8Q71DRAFT_722859 [Rhodofomes roseus]|uniref:Uncharacterized protein n=1 Tax=Rhodofomes roseus TaxID=34475 RepID=A0ABQ8KME8_9APHY|nr:uncharacterized protein C8Q71DRAFT_722859 [Rhodofomes roseus]KAH9838767.1 hypothetical protein C8Q71DRAFT_722859 [Rhodofomes roseus]
MQLICKAIKASIDLTGGTGGASSADNNSGTLDCLILILGTQVHANSPTVKWSTGHTTVVPYVPDEDGHNTIWDNKYFVWHLMIWVPSTSSSWVVAALEGKECSSPFELRNSLAHSLVVHISNTRNVSNFSMTLEALNAQCGKKANNWNSPHVTGTIWDLFDGLNDPSLIHSNMLDGFLHITWHWMTSQLRKTSPMNHILALQYTHKGMQIAWELGWVTTGVGSLKLWFVFCLKELIHSHKEACAKLAELLEMKNWSACKGLRLCLPPGHFDIPLPWEEITDVEVVALCPEAITHMTLAIPQVFESNHWLYKQPLAALLSQLLNPEHHIAEADLHEYCAKAYIKAKKIGPYLIWNILGFCSHAAAWTYLQEQMGGLDMVELLGNSQDYSC